MSIPVLDALTRDEFALETAFVSTVEALRRALGRSAEVRAVRRALDEGLLCESTIRRFVGAMMGDLRRGVRFPHDLAMAALAVALERRGGDFADEFLNDLARLELAEMSLSIRVARLCLRQRVSVVKTTAKVFNLRASKVAPRSNGRSPRIALTPWPEVTFRGGGSDWREAVLCQS